MGICCGKDDSRGMDYSSSSMNVRRVTLAPNMKNFKNLKYVEDISSVYIIGKQLGKGSFGSVNKCIRRGTDSEFAIKSI